jgi:hypothetical protein
MANIVGRKSYLALVSEATWGTFPGSPTYLHTPCNSWGVRFTPEGRQATPYVGVMQKRHARLFRGRPEGQAAFELYGWIPTGSDSLMEILLDWAFANPETTGRASYSAQWAQGPDTSNRQQTGLRVNTATLEGSEQNVAWTLNLNLIGKTDTALTTAQTIPNDREKLAEAIFQDSTFSFGGSAIALSSFRLERNYNLQVRYNNANRPELILETGPVSTTLNIQFQKTANTYDAVNRLLGMNEYAVGAVIPASHNGTGTGGTTNTVATLTLPRCSFTDVEDADVEQILYQGMSLEVLKPDTSDACLSIAYTEA